MNNRIFSWIAKILLSVLLFLLSTAVIFAQKLFVSPQGSDTNPGTKEEPFQTIQFALDQKKYETLILMDGTYSIEQPIRIKKSGSKKNPITIRAEHDHKAIIDAKQYVLDKKTGKTPNASGIASLHMKNVHHLKLSGIEVRNSHGMGIAVARASSNIVLYNCRVINSYNSGIGLWYSDEVGVFNCEIIGANSIEWKTENDRLGREAPHEALTIAGASNFEVAFNHVHHCEKEGIDVKEVSKHGKIHNNYIHDLPRQGLYVDCWFGLLQDVEFYDNIVHKCEWGMAISGEGENALMSNIRIHHNVIYDNRGSGIFFGVWGFDELRDSIYIYNNTIVNNGSKLHWAGPTGGIDIRSENIANTFIYNNICHNNYCFEIGSSIENRYRPGWLYDRNIIIINNHSGSFKSINEAPGLYGFVHAFYGEMSSEGNPLLSDAPEFKPGINSPARRMGWLADPFVAKKYIGAKE
jgi:hypothetical protein